jgi:hypothetical protein
MAQMNSYKILVEKSGYQLGDIDTVGRIILKWILKIV